MSIFGRKSKNSAEAADTKKSLNPTLDLIKETMSEAAKEKNTEQKANESAAGSLELKTAVAKFVSDRTRENLNAVLAHLQKNDTLVTIGAQVITGAEDEDKLKTDGRVKLEQPLKINPMLLTDGKGETVFPIFTGSDAMPTDMRDKNTKVNLPFANCVEMIGAIKNVETFVIDPYTANIRFTVSKNESR